MAAKFQLEDLNDVSSARSLLQQGLRVNSTSQHLWQEVRAGSLELVVHSNGTVMACQWRSIG